MSQMGFVRVFETTPAAAAEAMWTGADSPPKRAEREAFVVE